jgi:hypothetical protein
MGPIGSRQLNIFFSSAMSHPVQGVVTHGTSVAIPVGRTVESHTERFNSPSIKSGPQPYILWHYSIASL